MNDIYLEEIIQALFMGLVVATFLLNTSRALKAIELCKESLALLNKRSLEKHFIKPIHRAIYGTMFSAYCRISDNTNAITCGRKLLTIYREFGDRVQEGKVDMALANVFWNQSSYVKAKELYERAIIVMREIGDRAGEATCYGNLGAVFQSLGQYAKAKEYQEKALAIHTEIGESEGEAICYENLGKVLQCLGQYVKAKECYERALEITKKFGDKDRESRNYRNLGIVFQSLGEYVKAKEYQETELAIRMEIGDREGKATCYGNLGNVFNYLGQYVKAKEYYEKALAIRMEIGDKEGEAADYGNLGTLFHSFGQYVLAKDHIEKALAITKEIGDKDGEAANNGNLGAVFQSVGEHIKAREYYEKALKIRMEIGDRQGEADVYANLAVVSLSLREYRKSKEYYDKALALFNETDAKTKEAKVHGNFGVLLESIGDNVKAREYYEKSLAINLQIGDRQGEATNYQRLGYVLRALGECAMAEDYLEKALSIAKHDRYAKIEFKCYVGLTLTKLLQNKDQEAMSYLAQSITNCENFRDDNAESDDIKISLADKYFFPYQVLSKFFCVTGNPTNALIAVELGRARALADLMVTQYCAEKPISADPQSWTGLENVIKNESDCTCLYISYDCEEVFLWLLEKSRAIHFRNIRVEKKTLHTRLAKVARNLDEFFAIMAESFRSFGILPDEVCEDRSLNDINPKLESCREEGPRLRRGKDKGDPEPSLTLFYEMLINPVSDLLDKPEVIIVPDRGLYRVPFPALLNESGKYLSETFRIRIAPSLTTLKLIQDSPADYHSQTGALVVGDPDVGVVIYRGSDKKFEPLPGARKEAEMIGQLLGVEPLLGQHATKQAVLERITSVSLIHIAAHGNAERGEIALAPAGLTTQTPQEDDYLLKMSDISQVQVRAKLVVLSCCHSGRGQIRAEGVVGIARAFLGSGARSVLVALWALEDMETEHLMSRFYEHLVRGVSASECLYEAMKWMRENGFSKVHEWAPFMLIGDNVSFAFPKNQ